MLYSRSYMTEELELAWAAGFYDGEGCTIIHKSTLGDKRTKLRMSVGQKGEECLVRFQKALGMGKIYQRDCGISLWALNKLEDVDTALRMLWPYLSGPKRAQAE